MNGYIAKAANFAIQAHGNQRGKTDELYIHHPAYVAVDAYLFCKLAKDKLVKWDIEPYEIIIVAWLHDVLEDTDETMERIEKYVLEGMDSFRKNRIKNALELVTLDKNLTYDENMDKIFDSGNIVAIVGKGIDNNINKNRSRKGLDEQTAMKFDKKYEKHAVRFRPYIEELL